MTNKELAAKLRCISTVHTDDPGCENCPFWIKEPVPEELRDDYPDDFFCQCDCDRVDIEAADALENSESHAAALQQEIERLRGQLERQWIPVTERMPEAGEDVLTLGVTGVARVMRLNKGGRDWSIEVSRWHGFLMPRDSVTHWMPLPEPPKEESHD